MQETPYLKVFLQGSPYLKGQENLIERFNKLPYLKSFDDQQIRMILELSRIRKYDADEMIISEGMFDRWIYIILSGQMKVMKSGREIARLVQMGDMFGEMTAIDGKPRSASVIAVTEASCLAIDGSFLDGLAPEEKSAFSALFYQTIAGILANRLRLASEELARVKTELAAFKGEDESGPTPGGS